MSPAAAAGYSGTPLPKKLGIKPGMRVLLVGAPDDVGATLDLTHAGATTARRAASDVDLAHVFVYTQADLIAALTSWREALRPDVPVWVSWPKRASKVPTDITEDSIRAIALPMGYVDIKVCAVNAVWSGLKLVVRKALRQTPTSQAP